LEFFVFLGFHIVLFRSIACDFVVREDQLMLVGMKEREELLLED